MIDPKEIWLALILLAPGQDSLPLELDFAPRIAQVCKEAKAREAMGIELEWGALPSAAAIATLPSSADGKQFYIAWLKDRYGYNIAKLNRAYGLESTSFTDLTENDFKQVDRSRPAVIEDDRLFLIDLSSSLKQKIEALFQSCAPGRKTEWKRKRT